MILFVGFPIFASVIFVLLGILGVEENYILIPTIPYAAIFLFYGAKFSYAKCPICHEPMFHKFFFFYGFFRCVHCNYDLKDPNTSNVSIYARET